MFKKVLVANRGEIARRIIKTLRRMSIQSVAVCSEADVHAPFVKEADAHVVIGPEAPKDSYLNIDRILQAMEETGAEAVHPGYGFLSENPEFAERVRASGKVFIGPSAEAMRAVAGKLDARRVAESCGVPVVPGTAKLESVEEALSAAETLGYPVLLKASAGGGGIGMSVAKNAKQLERGFADVTKKGETFFRDGTVYLEKFVEAPAHLEVQILGDAHQNLVTLGERDCTVQRRNQKLLEETPSPRPDETTRTALFDAARKIGETVGYENAGTIEFVYAGAGDLAGQFFFLEVNARLQVEHPVTEMVTGLDLVEWQLRVAAGEVIPDEVKNVTRKGHAIEVRICAEDPEKHFFPSPGTLSTAVFPEPSSTVRVDTGVESGSVVSPAYDSMLAELIVHADNREAAIQTLQEAVSKLAFEGIRTNHSIFPKVVAHPEFKQGTHDTAFLKRQLGYKY